jgi:glyoxylase-like metal-dependent hydrolase (beta-lactamase superfamily II)
VKLFFRYAPHGFSNVYLVGPDGPGPALLVDPGMIDINLLSFVERYGYSIGAALVTHNHATHVRGLSTLRKIYDVEVYAASVEILDRPCRIVNDGQTLQVCGMDVEVLSLPGHTPDSVVYRIDKLVFTGDSLSAGLVGRTFSAYGSRQLLLNLWQKVLSLPDDCLILPGHGPMSTVKAERLYNMGLSEQAKRPVRAYADFDPPI